MAVSSSILSRLMQQTKPMSAGGVVFNPVSTKTRTSSYGGTGGAGKTQQPTDLAGISTFKPGYTGGVGQVSATNVAAPSISAVQTSPTPLYSELVGQARSELALGGQLNAGATRDATQQARAALAARGMAQGPAAVFAEVLSRDRFANERQQQRQQFGVQVEQAGQPERLANQAAENAARTRNAEMGLQAGISNQQAGLEAGRANQQSELSRFTQAQDLQAQMERDRLARIGEAEKQFALQGQSLSAESQMQADDWLRNATENRAIRDWNYGITAAAEEQAQKDAETQARKTAFSSLTANRKALQSTDAARKAAIRSWTTRGYGNSPVIPMSMLRK